MTRPGRHAALLMFLALLVWAAPVARAESPVIPNLWNPGERLPKPDLSDLERLRFLTTTDFPPFNFVDRRKRLAGFNVDLARAICEKLDIVPRCQIQALPWAELGDALEKGQGEAIIAGLAITRETREKYRFSRPYMLIPGRFASRRQDDVPLPLESALPALKTGLVEGSVHASWFSEAFPKAPVERYPTRAAALSGLKSGAVDLVFTDAVSLVFWLTSADAADCCKLAGGPYMASRLTGRGLAIAFSAEDARLAAAVDWALKEINDDGSFAELYLRYFPISLY